MDSIDRNIHELLRAMGLTRVYWGYDYLFYILRRDQDDPRWLALGNKQVCVDVARAFGTTPAGVDSALRTAIRICWHRGPGALTGQMMSGQRPPGVRPFLLPGLSFRRFPTTPIVRFQWHRPQSTAPAG